MHGGDLEKVDLMVGLLAEPLPVGFGFSETTYRILVLMTSRQLRSDRSSPPTSVPRSIPSSATSIS